MESDQLELLQSMPVFGGLNSESLQFLMQRASIQCIEKGDYFFHQGETAASMFVLESGDVAVIRIQDDQQVLIRALSGGDCFGEMALLDLYPRSSSILATSRCRAIEIGQQALFALYEENLEQFTIVQMNIGREISRRLRLSDEKLFQYVLSEEAERG